MCTRAQAAAEQQFQGCKTALWHRVPQNCRYAACTHNIVWVSLQRLAHNCRAVSVLNKHNRPSIAMGCRSTQQQSKVPTVQYIQCMTDLRQQPVPQNRNSTSTQYFWLVTMHLRSPIRSSPQTPCICKPQFLHQCSGQSRGPPSSIVAH